MCGITGIYSPNLVPDRTLLSAMNASIVHRGPDSQAMWNDDSVALGHCRLAIRDLTPKGNQPFFSHNGRYVMVYNGEIYNDKALQADLAKEFGFVRRTGTDTEVILEAFAHWGTSAFTKFEGFFALAIWDKEKKTLHLARDPVGIKPLYIDDTRQGVLLFASEIKALITDKSRTYCLEPQDVDRYLCMGHTSPERTLVQGIRQLPPGSALSLHHKQQNLVRYWKPARACQPLPLTSSLEQSSNHFITLFKEVVHSQLVSDVPLGVMQSGGIDSSLVSFSLPHTQNIPLFSVRFPGTKHDESHLVKEVAAALRRDIVWVDLMQGKAIEDDFRNVACAVDGQLADSTCLALYTLSRAIRSHAKVVLSGEGSDEFFGGYQTYYATALANRYKPFFPKSAAKFFAKTIRNYTGVSNQRVGLREKAARFLEGFATSAPHVHWRHYLANDDRLKCYGMGMQSVLQDDAFAFYASAFTNANGSCVDKALTADQQYYLPAAMLMKVDRISMAHNLEVRVPFLDKRIMEFANTLPANLFFDSFKTTKNVLRHALQQLGAPTSITHGKKLGFNLPMNDLITGDLYPLFKYYLHDNPDIFAPLLNADALRKLWKAHVCKKRDAKYPLWALAVLGTWMDTSGVQASL